MKDAETRIPELLTPKEVAVACRTTIGTLANDRCHGNGPPHLRLGGRVYYPAKELSEYISSRIVTPTPRAARPTIFDPAPSPAHKSTR